MKTHPATATLLLAALLGPSPAPAADAPANTEPGATETLVADDGTATEGRVEGSAGGGFRFVARRTKTETPLAPGMTIRFPGGGLAPASGSPPFRVELGGGQQLSGRVVALDARAVTLANVAGEGTFSVARPGVDAVVQRPGEAVVLQDGFDSIDEGRWAVVGEPEVVAEPRVAGAGAVRIAAGGTSLTHTLAEPFGSGRLEVAFHDAGAVAAGQLWFVDLTFRGAGGPETARVVLGWAEESLAVESPGGPALAVQRLPRRPGWHRLAVRFGPDQSGVAVDGNELAHGKGFGGPLTEIRLASSSTTTRPADARAPVGHLDDLRLVRLVEPVGGLETDATQDEVRLVTGDQLFGTVVKADAHKVTLTIDGRDVGLSWGEVSGLHLRRAAEPGTPVEGLLVRAGWRAGPGDDARDRNVIEGALVGLTPRGAAVATPYAGTVSIPRARLGSLAVVGRGWRLVVDPKAHHLGDEVSTTPPLLDPPQPEGGVLERAFSLPEVPAGAAFLVLDVVQVVGEAPDLQFSALVKKGELRTNIKLNGEPFDYLNRHITSRNETPERVRVPVPRALLRPGRNVVRLEQTGVANDPNFLDDLGVLGIAVEFAPAADPSDAR